MPVRSTMVLFQDFTRSTFVSSAHTFSSGAAMLIATLVVRLKSFLIVAAWPFAGGIASLMAPPIACCCFDLADNGSAKLPGPPQDVDPGEPEWQPRSASAVGSARFF